MENGNNIISKMCDDLQLEIEYVSNVIKRSKHYYKTYKIPKRNGNLRTIQQPSLELKTIQYWIVKNIINKYSQSEHAYAYCKNRSIKDNAEMHKKNPFILKIDIKNFFSNINSSHIRNMVKYNEGNCEFNSEEVIDLINDACLIDDRLPMGAVSSPPISNRIMIEFDLKITELCQKKDYTYTRYADDIYISSTDKIPESILTSIDNILKNYQFVRNKKKTRFMCIGMQRTITGLNITENGKVTLGTSKKKEIKKKIYKKFSHNEGSSSEILGHLNFIKDIEPLYYDRLVIKYSREYGDIITKLKNQNK